MRKLIIILFLFCGIKTFAQTADAGIDKTVYLTQGNTTTIGGASSATSYQWTDVTNNVQNPTLSGTAFNGFPVNTATITSPTSSTTTVTGLIQGVWYYQIAATTGATTKYDTCAIIVDYDVAPTGSSYQAGLPMDSIASVVNDRSDTTNYTASQWSYYPNYTIYFDRGRLNGEYVDTMRRKFYSTIEDGYQWSGNTYARSEAGYGFGNGVGSPVDSNKIYLFEWKGYFPQSDSLMINTGGGIGGTAVVIFQLHGRDDGSPPFSIVLWQDSLYFFEFQTSPYTTATVKQSIGKYSNFYNKTHTIRIEMKEGMGSSAYVKLYLDGTLKYSRTTGAVGRTWQQDWVKFASVYDYDNKLVDASTTSNRTRGRKFSLVTESWKVYTLSAPLGSNNPPTANAGADQTITLPTNSVTLSGSGNDADGTIASYAWTQQSGGSATITNPSSASTTVTGLTQGVYVFRLTVTDNIGATGYDDVQVTVNAAGTIINAIIFHRNYKFQ